MVKGPKGSIPPLGEPTGEPTIPAGFRYRQEGTVESVTVTREHASMILAGSPRGPFTITFYRDVGKTNLTPNEGMWRGAMLAVAQRALTHRHWVGVKTYKRTVPGLVDQDEVIQTITIHIVDTEDHH